MIKISKTWRTVLKFTVVIALLIFLSQRGLLSIERTVEALKQYHYTIPALLIMIFNAFLSIFRWHLLLLAQGIKISVSRVIQLSFIGFFFNTTIPGAVSGDVVKAYYVANETHDKKAPSLSSILFDRISGLCGLVCIATLALLWSWFYPFGFFFWLVFGGWNIDATRADIYKVTKLFTVQKPIDPELCRPDEL